MKHGSVNILVPIVYFKKYFYAVHLYNNIFDDDFWQVQVSKDHINVSSELSRKVLQSKQKHLR